MTKHLTQSAVYALVASTVIVSLTFMAFFVAEPVISHGQILSDQFKITQVITDETSFLVQPSNVTMTGDLNGVTGGNATGTTDFSVISNNSAGYNVTMSFVANAGSEAMYGDETGDESLRDYDGDVGGQPSYNWTASTAAQFAYTVTSETPSDSAQSFLSNGTDTCNTGSTDAVGLYCWKAPATTPFTIVDRSTSAITGATSTIVFRVHVPSGAVPVPQAESYSATATLSLSIN